MGPSRPSWVRRPIPTLRATGTLLLNALQEWVRDRCPGLAAALSFHCLLGVAPLLVLALVLLDRLMGEETVRREVVPVLTVWFGPGGVELLRFLLIEEQGVAATGLATLSVLGLIGLAVGAGEYWGTLRDAIETVWDVRREVARVRVQLVERLVGIATAVGVALVLAVTLGLAGLIHRAHAATLDAGYSGWPAAAAWTLIEWVGLFLLFAGLVAGVFKAMIPVKVTWRDVLPGAACTAALHLVGRAAALAVLAPETRAASVELGLVLLTGMLWFYYAHLMLLYGAEATRLYIQRYGSRRPTGRAA